MRTSVEFRFESLTDAIWLDIIRFYKAYGWL